MSRAVRRHPRAAQCPRRTWSLRRYIRPRATSIRSHPPAAQIQSAAEPPLPLIPRELRSGTPAPAFPYCFLDQQPVYIQPGLTRRSPPPRPENHCSLRRFVGRTPWSAADAPVDLLGLDESDFTGEERVQGDRRRPAGLPHDCIWILSFSSEER